MGQALTERMRLLGRLGGLATAHERRGNSAWGRKMLKRQGYLAQLRAYPGLLPLWRANGVNARLGRPLLPVPSLDTLRARPAGGGLEVQRGTTTDPEVSE